jgi:nitroreductase
MELDKAIQHRHSVRKFKDQKPSWKKIIECMDSVRYAPMAGNNFTLKLILIDDIKKIQKIAKACQQPFVGQAQYIVVVCSDPSRPKNAYEKRGEIFTRQQAGAAIQNFLLKIQEAGLSTCWVGYFVEEQIKRELKIPAKVQVEAVFPIGYEFTRTRKKLKIDMDRILYFNTYKNKRMKKEKKLDV